MVPFESKWRIIHLDDTHSRVNWKYALQEWIEESWETIAQSNYFDELENMIKKYNSIYKKIDYYDLNGNKIDG